MAVTLKDEHFVHQQRIMGNTELCIGNITNALFFNGEYTFTIL